jgi:MoxR-like ATPase
METSRKERIRKLLNFLSEPIFEKEEAMQLALLSALAGESLFLLGPPGVAKSLLARRLKFAFQKGQAFEYLMNRFSTPDEIFGPISIKKLKDEDKYERITEQYLPSATVVFLDEIWKASASIQNTLLTVLNEKIYRNGEQEMTLRLHGILAASNELPPQNEGLEALWDRFLLRYIISEIKENGNFIRLLTQTQDVYADNIPDDLKISQEEIQSWQREIEEIALPDEVLSTLQIVKSKLQQHDEQNPDLPFAIYDRRWKKIARLLKTAAFLNGRKAVDLMDCFLLVHVLWNDPAQIDFLRQTLSETIRKHGYTVALQISALKSEIFSLENEIETETQVRYKSTKEELYPVERLYYQILNLESHLEGKYLKRAEFDKLEREEWQTVSIYDENFKMTYRIKAKRALAENEIEIQHNAQTLVLKMRTHQVEKDEILYKAPHALLKKYWNEQITQILAYIDKQLDFIDQNPPQDLQHLDDNLFVPKSLSKIVRANLVDTINTLHELRLQVEKMQHYYLSLENKK